MKVPRILYIDDDADTCELLTLILRNQGFKVTATQDPDEGLKLAKRERFSLYIIDTWMPEMSGLEFCRKVRTFDPETPILFFSGAAYDADRARALECGAQGYLVKPADNDQLIAEVYRLTAPPKKPLAKANKTGNKL